MSAAVPSDHELRELRRQMLASARRSLPDADAEDVTQEALLRLVQTSRPSEIPLRRRGFRKLKDARSEFLRSPKRLVEAETQPLVEQRELACEDSALAVVGLEDLLESTAGADVSAYVRAKAAGLSDPEVAHHLGWDTKRVEAARKKYSRKQAILIKAMEDSGP
jgi:DNA-directed RNA polymerase specialized sigma24 family protein